MLLRRYHHASPDTESDEGTSGPGDVEPPALSASKAEWVAHAVTLGATQAEAEQLTKEQLIKQYGRGDG
ncbi:hypothetical protein QA943_18825 [Streptomyces sp. B21-097]|uniref:hypothetical protein n=1 Tax=Streptomyces sp. B21-097 TaxID=3039414 RepID=UPI002FF370B0